MARYNKQLQLTSMDPATTLLPRAARRADSAAEPRRDTALGVAPVQP